MSEPVRRPGSITAAAVVALLGSLMTFLAAVVMTASAFLQLEPPPGEGYKGLAIATGFGLAALSLLGVWTSIALLKLRAWARTSLLVFAGVLVVFGIFGLASALLIPLPPVPGADEGALRAVRMAVVLVFATPLLVGVWWLMLFNRQSAKDAFAAAAGGLLEPGMPLSISLTAWASIVGGVACLVPIVMRMPAFLLGFTLSGWAAGVTYAFFGALSIYIGRGLLDLQERARLLCIAWYAVSVVHMALVSFVPSLHARMLDAQQGIELGYGRPPGPGDPSFTWLLFLFVVLIAVLAIAFLHKHRALFTRASTEPE